MNGNYFKTVTANPYGNLSFSSLKTSKRAIMTHFLLKNATFGVDSSLATAYLAEHQHSTVPCQNYMQIAGCFPPDRRT